MGGVSSSPSAPAPHQQQAYPQQPQQHQPQQGYGYPMQPMQPAGAYAHYPPQQQMGYPPPQGASYQHYPQQQPVYYQPQPGQAQGYPAQGYAPQPHFQQQPPPPQQHHQQFVSQQPQSVMQQQPKQQQPAPAVQALPPVSTSSSHTAEKHPEYYTNRRELDMNGCWWCWPCEELVCCPLFCFLKRYGLAVKDEPGACCRCHGCMPNCKCCGYNSCWDCGCPAFCCPCHHCDCYCYLSGWWQTLFCCQCERIICCPLCFKCKRPNAALDEVRHTPCIPCYGCRCTCYRSKKWDLCCLPCACLA